MAFGYRGPSAERAAKAARSATGGVRGDARRPRGRPKRPRAEAIAPKGRGDREQRPSSGSETDPRSRFREACVGDDERERREPDSRSILSKERVGGIVNGRAPKLGTASSSASPLEGSSTARTRDRRASEGHARSAGAEKHGDAGSSGHRFDGCTQVQSVCKSRRDGSCAFASVRRKPRRTGALARPGALTTVTRCERARGARKGPMQTRANGQTGSRGCCLERKVEDPVDGRRPEAAPRRR